MSWDWLGGGIDFLTGGFTDFDNKGNSLQWGQTGSPIFGGSDNKWGPEPSNPFTNPTNWSNALAAAQKWTNTGGSSGGGGSSPGSFSYDRGTISNSPTFTTSTFGDDTWVSQPSPVIVLGPDNPEQPVYSSSGSGSSGGNKTLQTLGTIASIAAPFIKCDIRVKTDISPLKTTDITDDLAEVAFFVKGLRECS